MTYSTESFAIELFDHLILIKQILIFNWIVNDTLQHLEPFDCVQINE